LQGIVISWARKKKLRVLAAGHAVVCKASGAVMFVDFVFECTGQDDCMIHRKKCSSSTSVHRCFLASVYYAKTAKHHTSLHRYAKKYMQKVQKICNMDMDFSPTVLAICIHGNGSQRARVRVRDVGM
jgi:hypothetical protein